MDDAQRTRYSRHLVLPQIGEEGQQRLLDARVLVIGLGGLGSPAAMYLAASGVGHVVLSDFDHVELSNLQRQVIHTTADIGENKVDSARATMLALNPGIRVTALAHALDADDLADEVARADVVLDASDNFETRFEINAACVVTGTPLVSGAAIRMEAQVSVFQPGRADSPCYRCLYPAGTEDGEACSRVGVLAPLLGIIGSIQATECLKLLLGLEGTLTGQVLMLDAEQMEWRSLRLPRDPACPVCGQRPSP